MNPRLRWLTVLAILWLMTGIHPTADAQGLEVPFHLFGHDNVHHTIVKIDTLTGLATIVGPTSFRSEASAMTRAQERVPGPRGRSFAEGTVFGVLRDVALGKDFVVAVDVTSGEAIKVVETNRPIGGRGVTFGPDGVTLFLSEPNGALSTIDTVTGSVTLVGQTGFSAMSLEYDPDTASLLAISGNTLIAINPLDASASVRGSAGGLGDVRTCTVSRSPAGTWFSVNIRTKELVTINARTGMVSTVIGTLGPEVSGDICGTTFALEGKRTTWKESADGAGH